MTALEHTREDGYTISTDPARLQLAAIHAFLTTCYWSEGIPAGTVQRAIENSVCFGIYQGGTQVGFARVITDRATFAYLADVFVIETHRRRGLAEWLVRCILRHPDLQGLRRFMLGTRDAHALYARVGFSAPAQPGIWMERTELDVYTRNRARTPASMALAAGGA